MLSTGQHRQILRQTLRDFGQDVDLDLDLMQDSQTLAELTARLFGELGSVLGNFRPDLVLAQGDTTTVMAAAVLCFYNGIPFGHVEAGLRTHDLQRPFPEEFNRIVAARAAAIHFAPTERARANLLSERISPRDVYLTGNTVIDALLSMAARTSEADLPTRVREARTHPLQRLVLVTAHRRENFGAPVRRICAALRVLHGRFPDALLVYPMHPNPEIREVVAEELDGLGRMLLIPPVGYREMVALLKAATLVLTDSGGLQEEAPALGKPVLVLRDVTERPEAVEAGVVKVVGTSSDAIVSEASRLLSDRDAYAAMARSASPYGDGHASRRIVEIARQRLQQEALAA